MTEVPISRRNALRIALALTLVTLSGCGSRKGLSGKDGGGSAMNRPKLATLILTSDAFKDGQPIPLRFTCDGSNGMPALHWDNPPQGTRSFALVIDDPDAPGGTFRHFGVYDMEASLRSLAGGEHASKETRNDFGKPGYRGPCPPKGGGPHHYHFILFALDVDHLEIGSDAAAVDVEQNAVRHAIAKGELIGTYERK